MKLYVTTCHMCHGIPIRNFEDQYYLIVSIICSLLYQTRGGCKRFKHYENILLIFAFFCLVFHMTLNSHDTLPKKPWGSLGLTRYSYHASCKHCGMCFVQGNINK